MPICGLEDLTLNRYLGSVNSNIDKHGVHNSEVMKNLATSCNSSRQPIEEISFCIGVPEINKNIWGFQNI